MTIKPEDTAPDFEAITTEGMISFYEWMGNSWCLLLTHPSEFTPVCITELQRMASLKEEFTERNVKTIAINTGTLNTNKQLLKNIDHTLINFPIIDDHNHKVSMLFDLVNSDFEVNVHVRSVFIIDPEKKVRLTLTYPSSTGRNFYELLRIIDSLQLTNNRNVATPADWRYGEDTIPAFFPSTK